MSIYRNWHKLTRHKVYFIYFFLVFILLAFSKSSLGQSACVSFNPTATSNVSGVVPLVINQNLIDQSNTTRFAVNPSGSFTGFVNIQGGTTIEDKEIVIYCNEFKIPTSFSDVVLSNSKIIVFCRGFKLLSGITLENGSKLYIHDVNYGAFQNNIGKLPGVFEAAQLYKISDNSEMGIFSDDRIYLNKSFFLVGSRGSKNNDNPSEYYNPFDYSALALRARSFVIDGPKFRRQSRSAIKLYSEKGVRAKVLIDLAAPYPFEPNLMFRSEGLDPAQYGTDTGTVLELNFTESWISETLSFGTLANALTIFETPTFSAGFTLVHDLIGEQVNFVVTSDQQIRQASLCTPGQVRWDQTPSYGFKYFSCSNLPTEYGQTEFFQENIDQFCSSNPLVVYENEEGIESGIDDLNALNVSDVSNQNFDFNIYPNPASDFAYIELMDIPGIEHKNLLQQMQYGLVNSKGKIVQSSSIETFKQGKKIELHLKGLPPGIYFVVFQGTYIHKYKKLVIQ